MRHTGGGDIVNHCSLLDKGKNNKIEIGKKSVLRHCDFKFFGSNNKIVIGENCHLNDLNFWIEDNGNTILLGNKTSVSGQTQLACIEGTEITIGEDCILSSGIYFRTGDSHSVTDLNGNRTNPSKSIKIGDHVWIGHKAFLNKGVVIPSGCIVGACSVVTKQFETEHSVIAGNPAKTVKGNIDWKRERRY